MFRVFKLLGTIGVKIVLSSGIEEVMNFEGTVS